VAGGRPSEGPVEVHSNVLEGHGGGEQGEQRAPRQGAHPRSRAAVTLLWGKPPDRSDTTPLHEPGTGREQSRNTPLGG